MKFDHLFAPGRIGTMEVKNRLIVPPMLTEYAGEDGTLTERYIRYYEEKARGGWGLIICEDNTVDEFGAGFRNLAGIWSDEMIAAHRSLTDRVHRHGAKIAVQLYHAGRESNSSIKGRRPVAPSPIQDPTEPETPHELMESLRRYDTQLLENTKTLEITEHGVLIEKDGVSRLLPAELVVLAAGSHPNDALARELGELYPVTAAGDALTVGKALDGIHAAYKAALEL